MNIELKPCSFCGGEAEIKEYDNRDIHGYKVGVGCKDDDSNCLMGDETKIKIKRLRNGIGECKHEKIIY